MFKKMKEWLKDRKQYKEAKKALTLILLNEYNEFLESGIKAQNAAEEANKSMAAFSEVMNPEELKKLITGVNTIANSPQLQTDYFKQVNRNAHEGGIAANKTRTPDAS